MFRLATVTPHFRCSQLSTQRINPKQLMGVNDAILKPRSGLKGCTSCPVFCQLSVRGCCTMHLVGSILDHTASEGNANSCHEPVRDSN